MSDRQLANPHDVNLAPSQLPVSIQYAGVALFVLGVVASGFFSLTEHWRRATFCLGVSMIGLGVLRMVADSTVLGVLAVRSRLFDVMFCTALGGVMVFLAASVDSLGS